MNKQLYGCVPALLACALAGSAQEKFEAPVPAPARETEITVLDRPAGPAVGLRTAANFQYIGAESGMPGKVVKGAPYSAEAVTQTTQSLADGNKISHKSTSSVYRDSEGRTRREMSLPVIGPWASSGEPPRLISIYDPVAGAFYTLNANDKTAHKLPAPYGKTLVSTVRMRGAAEGPRPEKDVIVEGPVLSSRVAMRIPANAQGAAGEAKIENLGNRTIEGVVTEGTRETTVIAAGEIGNERPIEIVDERWYSPELQTVVLSRHTDPRMGETEYRLTNVQRSEPVPSLFQVPADYTLSNADTNVRVIRKMTEK